MPAYPDLAPVAALIGDPTRATILTELFNGAALTAGELAARSGITAPTASSHLGKLVEGGLLAMVRQGRHRYYRLASPEVAAALEGLVGLAPAPRARNPFDREVLSGLRFARSCYGHLAGRGAVALRARRARRRPDRGRPARPGGARPDPAGPAWRTRGVLASRGGRRSGDRSPAGPSPAGIDEPARTSRSGRASRTIASHNLFTWRSPRICGAGSLPARGTRRG